MRIGVTLPSFTSDAGGVLVAARSAEEAGLHGVFSFDHQWPLGHPERPSLAVFPLLGAVAAVTDRVRVGTLVARIGLLPDDVVLASLESLHVVLGGRLIAGLGTGDEASEPEHRRLGLPYLGVAARLESLSVVASRLEELGVECWIGGGRPSTNETAPASSAILNLWGARPAQVAALAGALRTQVTWGGPLPRTAKEAARQLAELAAAGASWVIWAWPPSLEVVCEAVELAGVPLDGD